MNKIDLMLKISENFSLYNAGKWLGTPRKELNGLTPANYIKKNKIKEINDLLEKDIANNGPNKDL
jgi:hypothetical protein